MTRIKFKLIGLLVFTILGCKEQAPPPSKDGGPDRGPEVLPERITEEEKPGEKPVSRCPLPDSAKVTLLKTTKCDQPYKCTINKLEIEYEVCGKKEKGYRFTLFKPESPLEDPMPLAIEFGGSEDPEGTPSKPPTKEMKYATMGIGVIALTTRGHHGVYKKGDELYGQATWLGPEEMADYDRAVSALLEGWVDPDLPKADPSRIGVGGVSQGGMKTLIWGRHTIIPKVYKHPIAVALPSGATPDFSDWWYPGMDPNQLKNKKITSWGSIRLTGFPGHLLAYEGDYVNYWIDQMEENTINSSEELLKAFEERSAYDPNRTIDSYINNVSSTLISMSAHDCVIPKSSAFRFYDQILKVTKAPKKQKLISPIGYHSCGNPEKSYGYLPRWTEEVKKLVEKWKDKRREEWFLHFMLKDKEIDIDSWPAWMFMFPNEGDEQGEVPKVYAASAPGSIPISWKNFYLGIETNKLTTTIPGERKEWQLIHQPGKDCKKLDLRKLRICNDTVISTLVLDTQPLKQDMVVVGNPKVIFFGKEKSAQPFLVVFILAEVPDPKNSPEKYWPVTSERRYDCTDTGSFERHEVELDFTLHRFSKGSAIRLIITNFSLKVADYKTMFARLIHAYEAVISSYENGEYARLSLPVMTEPLKEAPARFQLIVK